MSLSSRGRFVIGQETRQCQFNDVTDLKLTRLLTNHETPSGTKTHFMLNRDLYNVNEIGGNSSPLTRDLYARLDLTLICIHNTSH